MTLLDFFTSRKKNTADVAKERLQIIVTERRFSDGVEPHYFLHLRKDILEVIYKYVQIDPDMVTLQLKQRDNDTSTAILELNIMLPEVKKARS